MNNLTILIGWAYFSLLLMVLAFKLGEAHGIHIAAQVCIEETQHLSLKGKP